MSESTNNRRGPQRSYRSTAFEAKNAISDEYLDRFLSELKKLLEASK